jgi:hypothetical protein
MTADDVDLNSRDMEHILAKLGASRRAEIATWTSAVERAPLAN